MKNLIRISIAAFMCISLNASASRMDLPVVCGHESLPMQQDDIYGVLNYGLSWFSNGAPQQALSATPLSYCDQDRQKSYVDQNGQTKYYFSPSKKHTLIFVHGYAPLSSYFMKRFNFDATDIAGPNVNDLVAPWLSGAGGDHQPWNVGVFYWNQLADEQPANIFNPTPESVLQSTQVAEAKIWKMNGPDGMSWRDNQNNLHLATSTQVSQNMAQTFANQYIAQLKDYANQTFPDGSKPDFRLVGESLGSQIVIHGAKLIADQVNDPKNNLPKNLIPSQIVLLDPMVSKGVDDNGRSYMDTLLDDVTNYLKPAGVIFSGYRTTQLGEQPAVADNTDLLNLMAFSDMAPAAVCAYPGSDMDMMPMKNRHTFGIWWYLLSYTLPNFPLSGQPNVSAPFAGMSNGALKDIMNSSIKYVSDNGTLHPCAGMPDYSLTDDWSKWQMKAVSK